MCTLIITSGYFSPAQGTWLANQAYLMVLKFRAEADVHHNADVNSRPIGPFGNSLPLALSTLVPPLIRNV